MKRNISIIKKRKDIPFNWIYVAFSIFIFACGATHFLEIWTIWMPIYGFSGLIKLVTAIASLVTAVILIKLIPKILSLASPEQIKLFNIELQKKNDLLNEANKKILETQNQLLQSEKMASIGLLAAGIAHEINNPIGYVTSNFSCLEEYHHQYMQLFNAYSLFDSYTGKEEEQRQDIFQLKEAIAFDFLREDIPKLFGESLEGLSRIQTIVKNLKDFSHPSSYDNWSIDDIHKGLDTTLSIAWNEIKYKAEVIKDYGIISDVECLPAQLNQVFLNILINAAQSLESQGTITIKTQQKDNTVIITISDTGLGIPENLLGKIFDPFFTTKEVGKGTGLGLSLSYGIIKKHHGKITVNSELGKGSAFSIYLPIWQPFRGIENSA